MLQQRSRNVNASINKIECSTCHVVAVQEFRLRRNWVATDEPPWGERQLSRIAASQAQDALAGEYFGKVPTTDISWALDWQASDRELAANYSGVGQ